MGVLPEALAVYGALQGAMAGIVTTAGEFDAPTNVSEVSSTVGGLGSDFVGSFADCQATHLESVTELAIVHLMSSANSASNIANYLAQEELGSASMMVGA